eukprot:350848-Chlamydomonas_euryale.AAC.14
MCGPGRRMRWQESWASRRADATGSWAQAGQSTCDQTGGSCRRVSAPLVPQWSRRSGAEAATAMEARAMAVAARAAAVTVAAETVAAETVAAAKAAAVTAAAETAAAVTAVA